MSDFFSKLFGHFFTDKKPEQEQYDKLKKEISLLGDSCGLEIDYTRDLLREKECDYQKLIDIVKTCRKRAEQFRLDAKTAEELAEECKKLQEELQKIKDDQETSKWSAAEEDNANITEMPVSEENDENIVEVSAAEENLVQVSAAEDKTSESMLKGLIRYRDSLDIFHDNALEEGEKQIAGIMENMKKETKRILEESGIQVLDAVGIPFSEEMHYIEDIKQTEDASLDEMVAETYRDGYRKDGILLRPQKVVIYQYRK